MSTQLKNVGSGRPIWWEERLVRLFDTLYMRCHAISIGQFLRSMRETWSENCTPQYLDRILPSNSSLQKLFGVIHTVHMVRHIHAMFPLSST